MRVIAAAVIVAFLAGPALAQEKQMPQYGQEDKEKSMVEKNADKEAEKAYKRSLGNIPAQKAQDPWGNVRPDNSAKPDAKETRAAPKKPKAATSSN